MKKILLLTTTILLSVCLFAQSGEAQGRPQKKEVKRIKTSDSDDRMHKKPKMQHDFAISGLTEEQRNSIKELRLAMTEEVVQNVKLLQEKRTYLAKLQGESQPNQAAINTTIDEITALKGQIMKSRADFRIKIGGLLTEEQRAKFQNRATKMRKEFSERTGDDRTVRTRKGEATEAYKGKMMKAKKATKAD